MTESVHLNSLDDDVLEFVPDEVFDTVEKARDIVRYLMKCYGGSAGPFVYPVLLSESGVNIGYVQAVPLKKGIWEIGYHIAEKHTRNGYATEAVSAFIPIIMGLLEISELYGICHINNTASKRILEKCGFKSEGKRGDRLLFKLIR